MFMFDFSNNMEEKAFFPKHIAMFAVSVHDVVEVERSGIYVNSGSVELTSPPPPPPQCVFTVCKAG